MTIERDPMKEPEDTRQETPGEDTRGVGTRVLREIIRTPAFQEIIKTNMTELDPDEAGHLVRTAFWEDLNLSLSLMGTSPVVVNYLIEAFLELGRQLNQFPAGLLNEFISNITSDMDNDALTEIPEVYGQLLEKVLLESPELREKVFAGLFSHLAGAIRAAAAILSRLEKLESEEPSGERQAVDTAELGQSLGDALNQVSRLAMKLHAENPELVSVLFPAVDGFMTEADFGKLRVATAGLAESATALGERVVEGFSANPVIVANVLGMLPPVVNSLIKIVSHLLGSIEMPSEVLASALFTVLKAVDTEEVGKAVNSAAGLVNQLHEGNFILGRDEFKFRSVFAEVAGKLLANVDLEQAAQAAAGLSEDAETMARATMDLVSRDPELMVAFYSLAVSLSNTALRAYSNILLGMGKLPDDVFLRIGDDAVARLEVAELGNVINNMVALSRKVTEVNPTLHQDIMSGLLGSIDMESIGEWARGMSLDVADMARRDPVISTALRPEEVGKKVNAALTAFNRSTAGGTRGATDYVSKIMSQIDTVELEKAAHTIVLGAVDGALASADKAMAFMKPLATALWRVVKFCGRRVKERIAG